MIYSNDKNLYNYDDILQPGETDCFKIFGDDYKDFKENVDKAQKIQDKKNKKRKKEREKARRAKQRKQFSFSKFCFVSFKILLQLTTFAIICIFIFFKTTYFEKYRDIWVLTAMSTMNHQYLATWFLTDEEIQTILAKNEVVNNEDSDVSNILIPNYEELLLSEVEEEKREITVEKIKGSGYVGYVMQIPDPSKVELVDTRKSSTGTKLSDICKNKGAVAGINAGGFADPDGNGYGNILCHPTMIDQKLLYGDKTSKYSWIGLTTDKKLSLGKYTYNEAINNGIESAIEFGPYIIVNGNNQITNSSAGGIHPRTAIGQKQDGTFVFVVIDGRQPGYSLGTNLLELQNILNRYDVYNAANLDGGSSTTMYYNGEIVNKPSTPIGQRYLPNAFIVKE